MTASSSSAPPDTPAAAVASQTDVASAESRSGVLATFWFISKNVLGWLLILAAWPVGIAIPGPGGIPIFLLGFALVTFPGKRKLTTRFMRGRGLPINSPVFTGLITFISILVTVGLIWFVDEYYARIIDWLGLEESRFRPAALMALCLLAVPVTMGVLWVGLRVLNWALRAVPKGRRLMRPWLRKYGIRLLPTRRRRVGGRTTLVHDEILEIEEHQRLRLRRAWIWFKPWGRRVVTYGLTLAFVFLVVTPIVQQWDEVRQQIRRLGLALPVSAVVLMALSLVLVRTVVWAQVVVRVARPRHGLPVKAALRVWSLGHIARYLGGRVYQVLRMEMSRPYGISAIDANVAQRLEGVLRLAAAVAVMGVTLWIWAWMRTGPVVHGVLIGLALAGPFALLLLTRRTFYSLLPRGSGAVRPGHPQSQLPTLALLAGFTWSLIGLTVEGIAAWQLIGRPLGLVPAQAYLVVTAWSLSWAAAAFLARWAPGGLGVREAVFVIVLGVLCPSEVRNAMVGEGVEVWWAFLFLLSVLLRLALAVAELLVASLATIWDWNGMVRTFETMRPREATFSRD